MADELIENENAGVSGEMVYAGFLRRGFAVVLDGVVMAFAGAVIITIIGFVFGALSVNIFNNIGIIIYIFYYIFMIGKYGQTFGKKWLNVKVVNDDGSSVGYAKAALRLICSALSGFILFMGYIVYFFNPRRKTLHDYILKTVVLFTK
ncbi:MAG: RDD family protein [Elusimicrobiota bacterium]